MQKRPCLGRKLRAHQKHDAASRIKRTCIVRNELSAAQQTEAINRRSELIKALAEAEKEKPVATETGIGKGGRGKTDKAPASLRDVSAKRI